MTSRTEAAKAAEHQTVLSFDERERILCQFISEPINHDREMAIAIEAATQEKLLAPLEDYERVLADHRRLVRELDVLLNGDGAAPQASLCDIVAQVRRAGIKASAPVADRQRLRELVDVVWNEATESTALPDTPWADRLIDKVYPSLAASSPVAGEAKNYPGENVAERLDNMADDQPPGSQAQSDLYAAATIWRKHIAHRAAPQASAEAGDDELVYLGATVPPVPAWLLKSARRISHYMATHHPGEWAIYGIQIRREPKASAQGGISG